VCACPLARTADPRVPNGYKADNPLGIRDLEEHIGVVAQEVQRMLPEVVTENNKGYLLVNNDPILWSMLNAIKEQLGQIRDQKRTDPSTAGTNWG